MINNLMDIYLISFYCMQVVSGLQHMDIVENVLHCMIHPVKLKRTQVVCTYTRVYIGIRCMLLHHMCILHSVCMLACSLFLLIRWCCPVPALSYATCKCYVLNNTRTLDPLSSLVSWTWCTSWYVHVWVYDLIRQCTNTMKLGTCGQWHVHGGD